MSLISLMRNILAFLFSGIIVLSASLGTVIGRTDGTPIIAEKREYCFDNSGLIIGAYCFKKNSDTQQLLTYAKEAGIQVLFSGVYEEYLDLCDEMGMGVIASSYNVPGTSSQNILDRWLLLNSEDYDYSHECIWGNNIIDEPNASLMPKIGEAVEHYYNNTTGKLPFVNLLPIYANDKQLGNTSTINETMSSVFWSVDWFNTNIDKYRMHASDYINNVDTDIICVDLYPLYQKENEDGTVSKTTERNWLRNLDILAEACRETGRDLWVITQSAGMKSDEETDVYPRYCDTPEDIRWQAYVSLAFGAKAIVHCCYYGGWWDKASNMIDSDGNRTDTYYAVQTVDGELALFADIFGNYSNKGAYLVNGYLAAGNETNYLVPVAEEYKPFVCSRSPVLVGCFDETEGDGRAYTVVNMWELGTGKSADAKLCFDGVSEITLYRGGVESKIAGNTLDISLAAGEGVFVTVK